VNPNIRALQFAEQELREHDRRAKEMADEVREYKRTRAALAARVQECIDVLCGKVSPDLFAGVPDADEPSEAKGIVIFQCPKCLVFRRDHSGQCECGLPPAEPAPLVCAPVGSARLADIDGVTKEDAEFMAAVGLVTLADLAEECGDDLAKRVRVLTKAMEPKPN